MELTNEEILFLEEKAREIRLLVLNTTYWANGGHIGGALSVCDIAVSLYYKFLNIDTSNPSWEKRDRIIFSKGHAGILIACILADEGFINKEQLKTYNHTGSKLGMHLDKLKVPGLDASTGSLGHGLSIGAGIAAAAKSRNEKYKIFVILGDGECDEGSIWEAALFINHYCLSNLITIVDRNKLMYDGRTEEVMKIEPFKEKWESFGFNVLETDGHNFKELALAFDRAINNNNKPTCIICNTVKGCGIAEIEGNYKSHYISIKEKEVLEKYKKLINAYHDERKKKWEN